MMTDMIGTPKKQPATSLDLICFSDEAAELLGVSERRILQLCESGELKARRGRRDWVIEIASLKAYGATPRKRGPKPKE